MASNIVFDGTKGISLPSFTTSEKNAIVSPATGATVFDTTQNRQNVYAGGAWNAGLNSGSSVTASGTSVDFTGIPSWVKRITVSFRNISTTGNLNFGVRVGTASGIVTSGYLGTVNNYSAATSNQYSSNELIQTSISNAGGSSWSGTVVLINPESNFWLANTNLALTNTNGGAYGAGHINAAATLTTIRIMALSTETFDGGSINILYE